MRIIISNFFLVLCTCFSCYAQSSSDYFRKGKEQYDSSLYKIATDNFTQSITLNPRFDSAYHYRGYCYFKLKDTIKADKDWQTAISVNSRCNIARFYHASVKYYNNDTLGSIRELDTVLLSCFRY